MNKKGRGSSAFLFLQMNQRLGKSYRLKSKTIITQIFQKKQGFIVFPIRINYTETALDSAVKIVFSVPKKRVKKAVHRNRIKRLMREAFRLNQSEFIEKLKAQNKSVAVYIGYVGNEIPTYALIEEKIKLSLVRLLEEIEKQ